MKTGKSGAGFTLVELLIVISIIAILTVIGLTTYAGVQKNARDARRKDDLRAIKVALELYYQTNKTYPVSDWVYSTTSSFLIPGLNYNYIAKVPVDPLKNDDNSTADDNKHGYGYYSNSAVCGNFGIGQFFALVTKLENTSDNQKNGVQEYLWCNRQKTHLDMGWSEKTYVVTSEM